MISERETLERLVGYHDHIAVPQSPVEEDVRRGRRRVRRNRGLLAGGAALAVVAIAIGVSLASGQRVAERPHPAELTSTTHSPAISLESLAPLRPGPAEPPAAMTRLPEPDARFQYRDGRDAELGAIDIDHVNVERFGGDSRMDWWLGLREDFPTAVVPGQVIEYGLVLDTDGDRLADCQIGVGNDGSGASDRGPYRSWVTNLRTGRTAEERGAPYGRLIDFSHPQEGLRYGPDGETRVMRFFFIFHETGPCAGYGASSAFYAWAAVGSGGHLAEVDYAPDTAWLQMPG